MKQNGLFSLFYILDSILIFKQIRLLKLLIDGIEMVTKLLTDL